MENMKWNLNGLGMENTAADEAAYMTDAEKSQQNAIQRVLEDVEIEIECDDFTHAAALLDGLRDRFEDSDLIRVHKIYWLRLLIEYQAHNIEELAENGEAVLSNSNYKKAVAYAKKNQSPDLAAYEELPKWINENELAEILREFTKLTAEERLALKDEILNN